MIQINAHHYVMYTWGMGILSHIDFILHHPSHLQQMLVRQ